MNSTSEHGARGYDGLLAPTTFEASKQPTSISSIGAVTVADGNRRGYRNVDAILDRQPGAPEGRVRLPARRWSRRSRQAHGEDTSSTMLLLDHADNCASGHPGRPCMSWRRRSPGRRRRGRPGARSAAVEQDPRRRWCEGNYDISGKMDMPAIQVEGKPAR